ncbi:3-hydroxyacyl-CoA dehydrogenase family protein [Gottfriedia sp. NPDC057991]|uniref:3-hydroxyacyl-CoA dehydrogenase family protein n=1 Tax=Gottfriedia sp. NPDC057991 TaxID=3346298 RepID=UPI0036DA3E90
MRFEDVKKIAVIGSGAMGSQIAMVCALGGYTVVLHDISDENLETAKEKLVAQMERRIQKGTYSQNEVNNAFTNIMFSSDFGKLEDVDFVIEAIIENIDVKRELFLKLDEVTPKHAILATNSSTIVSSKLADVTNRPEKVCNIHFFNPALSMELVEVVRGPHTSEETADIAVDVIKQIRKVPVLLKKEIFGFIANRILGKIIDEAIYLLEEGIASHEDIDLVCKKALNHPIGPFSIMDLTGLDVNYLVRMQRYKESGESTDLPSNIVKEKVEKGELGRKTGKGFYSYIN